MYNVTVEDMGVYRCVADNNIKPPAEHLAQVLIFHAPKTRIVQNSVGQAQNRRFDAKLECIVRGESGCVDRDFFFFCRWIFLINNSFKKQRIKNLKQEWLLAF